MGHSYELVGYLQTHRPGQLTWRLIFQRPMWCCKQMLFIEAPLDAFLYSPPYYIFDIDRTLPLPPYRPPTPIPTTSAPIPRIILRRARQAEFVPDIRLSRRRRLQ